MKIFEYYEKYGNKDYIGEEVSQIEHMVQCAMIAEENNEDIYMILACLFHDIGHLIQIECEEKSKMGEYGLKNHEKIGKQYLIDNGIPQPIPDLVESHVSSKRYLTFKKPEYTRNLSDASKQTLIFQGGPMDKEEALKFENSYIFKRALKLREYDDKAKVKGKKINNLKYYEEMLKKIKVNL